MADQKNASFLYYLRSFFKQGDSNCENGYGTPRNKRKGEEELQDGSDLGDNSPNMMITNDDDDNGDALSHSNKRRCRSRQ